MTHQMSRSLISAPAPVFKEELDLASIAALEHALPLQSVQETFFKLVEDSFGISNNSAANSITNKILAAFNELKQAVREATPRSHIGPLENHPIEQVITLLKDGSCNGQVICAHVLKLATDARNLTSDDITRYFHDVASQYGTTIASHYCRIADEGLHQRAPVRKQRVIDSAPDTAEVHKVAY